jgi:hypothetical protein
MPWRAGSRVRRPNNEVWSRPACFITASTRFSRLLKKSTEKSLVFVVLA